MFRLEDTQKAAGLFAGNQETMVWSCLDQTMGDIYVENLEVPQGAAACLGDFCFLAGIPKEELISPKLILECLKRGWVSKPGCT